MSGPFTAGHKVFNTDLNPILLGWVDFSWFGSTLTWVSTDGPTFVFKINADVTAVIESGMRVKLTQTTDKFFIVTAVSTFSGGFTQLTVYGGTDYTLLNAAISAGSFSTHKKPFGFNANPAKWTETLRDTTQRTAAAIVGGTWYNPGSLSLNIPIGAWVVSYEAQFYITVADNPVNATLSTASSSESDSDFTTLNRNIGSANQWTTGREKAVTVTVKTPYYLNVRGGSTSGDISVQNGQVPGIVRAVCAYL